MEIKKIASARITENEHTALRRYCLDKKTTVQKLIKKLLQPYLRIK